MLRAELNIPVWHDDQQGAATVLFAGLMNALKLVGKRLERIRLAMIGTGAANAAVYRLRQSAPGNLALGCESGGRASSPQAVVIFPTN